MTRYRDSDTGRYTTPEDAAERPSQTVGEALPEPVNLEAAAQRLHKTLVPNSTPWQDLTQELRDNYRKAARAVLEQS